MPSDFISLISVSAGTILLISELNAAPNSSFILGPKIRQVLIYCLSEQVNLKAPGLSQNIAQFPLKKVLNQIGITDVCVLYPDILSNRTTYI